MMLCGFGMMFNGRVCGCHRSLLRLVIYSISSCCGSLVSWRKKKKAYNV